MLHVDAKADSAKATLSQLLLGNTKESDGTFSKMLQKLALKDIPFLAVDGKGGLAANEQSEEKGLQKGLLNLLKGSKAADEGSSPLEKEMQQLLNPKLASLPAGELAAVIKEAKSFLKEQIREAVQIKELPKTLGGLLKLAEKIGIDISKITLDQIQPEQGAINEKSKNLALFRKLPAEIATQQLVENKQMQQSPVQKNDEGKKSSEPLRSLLHTPVEQGAKPQALNTGHKGSAQPEHQHKPLASGTHSDIAATTAKADAAVEQKNRALNVVAEATRASAASEGKQSATSIINETGKNAAAAILPQNNTEKTQKKSDNPRMTTPGLIAETAPVKSELPATTAAVAQPGTLNTVLNQLLRGTTGEEGSAENMRTETTAESKTHASALGLAKPDDLNQKLLEAKQTVRHFAGEIKEAVENYKPPFTRIKIRLNPVKLGEVDVTMIQRGNNVHINITSNNTAISTLAQHATELKMQLAQNGVSNATMNFSNGNGTGNEQQQQQQRQQQQQHAAEQYRHFDQQEEQPPLYTQLELIVPRYI